MRLVGGRMGWWWHTRSMAGGVVHQLAPVSPGLPHQWYTTTTTTTAPTSGAIGGNTSSDCATKIGAQCALAGKTGQ